MKIAVVNSRKPRQFHSDERWLQWSMALGYAIAQQGHTLCTSTGTIGYEAALFGAAMGGGKIKAFVTWNEERSVADCIPAHTTTNLLTTQIVPNSDRQLDVLRDRDVLDDADLVIAVAIRSGGYMEALLRTRFFAGKKLQVVFPDEGPLWRGTRSLLELGVPLVAKDLQQLVEERLAKRSMDCRNEPDVLASIPAWNEAPLAEPTLAHFTRAADGPWSRQVRAEYLEDLWHGGWRGRRDARAALSRIVDSRKILASGRLIKQKFPVVSFTAVSPKRISELHRYRSHLLRWDFEPWGIVFDRDWLVKRGARPVKYLPSNAFAKLDPRDKPFFQKHEPPDCDYSAEEEWRIEGDLDFADVPKDAMRLFVGD